MTTVRVTALHEVRRALGWSSRDVQFVGGTLEELLRQIETQDGRTLRDLLVHAGTLRGEYAVIVNGVNIAAQGGAGLSMMLDANDHVVAMAVMRVIAGGCA